MLTFLRPSFSLLSFVIFFLLFQRAGNIDLRSAADLQKTSRSLPEISIQFDLIFNLLVICEQKFIYIDFLFDDLFLPMVFERISFRNLVFSNS